MLFSLKPREKHRIHFMSDRLMYLFQAIHFFRQQQKQAEVTVLIVELKAYGLQLLNVEDLKILFQ